MNKTKVTVIGAGIWGVWTAYFLNKMGAEVKLIDAWGAGNARSGSGGEGRIIRLAYGSDSIYVDLTARSFEIWDAFFEEKGLDLYTESGVLWLFHHDAAYIKYSMPEIAKYGQPVETLSSTEAKIRFPQFNSDTAKEIYFEPKAGVLKARRCCEEVCKAFQRNGGSFQKGWVLAPKEESESLKQVKLSDGSTSEADVYVFACGPWNKKMFPKTMGELLYISRQELFYFGVPAEASQKYSVPEMPIWLDFDYNDQFYYGIPNSDGRGIKLGYDVRTELFDPDTDDRTVNPERLKAMREYLGIRFPKLKDMPLLETRVCQYENSIDGHFLIDRHPHYNNVFLMGGSSGHGFKMSPAIGEMMAKSILNSEKLNSFFRFERLSNKKILKTQFGNQKNKFQIQVK